MSTTVAPGIEILRSAATRMDSFVNVLTGQGDATLDKGAAWDVQTVTTLTPRQLKNAYRGSYYARRVVDLVAEDATVRGFEIVDPTDPRATMDRRWKQEGEALGLAQVLTQALKWARAYGTGYIVPITYDLQPLNQPISPDLLYQVQDLVVLDPWECQPQSFWAEDTAVTKITEPSAYRINAGLTHSGKFRGRWGKAFSGEIDIHPSRVIPIVGAPLSIFDRLSHPYGLGDSVLQAMWLALARADGIDAAAALLAQEMKQDVVRVPDLKAIGTSDAREAFEMRMRLLKLSKGLLNMILLGAGEEYESRANSVQGFKDLTTNARDALVAATGIPEPILFGKATSGLATAPGTEQEAYIRKIQGVQLQQLQPALRRVLTLIVAAKMGPFAGQRMYRDFEIRFNPLSEESKKEADARTLILAQRDSIHGGMISAVDDELGGAFARYIVSNRYGEQGWQETLPPFKPEEWIVEKEPAPTPPPSPGVPPAPGADAQAPESPDGQQPDDQTPQGQGKDIGAQGVDLQPSNPGVGRLDSANSQAVLTEWVQMDADVYTGEVYNLPAAVKSQAQQVLVWRQQHPEIVELLSDDEWRQIRQLALRLTVGEGTVRHMYALGQDSSAYDAALQRSRLTREPWNEPAILRWRGWGGTPGRNWSQLKTLDTPTL